MSGRQRYSAKVKALAALELRRRKFRAFCAQFRDDPVAYGREVFGWNPTPKQEEICRLVVSSRRSTVMASHAIGKTNCAGILANWWFDCFDESIVYITAPTWEQALGLTFKEIKRFRLGGSVAKDWEDPRRLLWDGPLPGIIQETGRILDESKARAMTHYIKAINAERAEGFQGEHSAPILILLEEAVGIGSHIWEGTEGLMTVPEARWLAIANPTDEATDFGRATKRPSVSTLQVSVFEHPNIAEEIEGKKPLVPLAVRLQWLRDMLADHCELADPGDPDAFEYWSLPAIDTALQGKGVSKQESPTKWWYKPNAVFEGRALGRFPGQAFEQVIPRKWLENLPVLVPPADELPEIGADIARHGDDRTVIASRQGPCLLALRTLRQMDLNVVTAAIRDAVAHCATTERGTYDPKSLPVRIDVTGGLGAGPADTLAAEGYTVEYVNSAETSDTTDEAGNVLYPNMRSELWFACRERARRRELDFSRIPADDRQQLIDELATPKWELTPNGRKKVEDKRITKKKLKWSPDLADAVNLAFKAPAVAAELQNGDLPDWPLPWGRA
jgi:phage terminase large subunit